MIRILQLIPFLCVAYASAEPPAEKPKEAGAPTPETRSTEQNGADQPATAPAAKLDGDRAPAVESKFGETQRFIFYSILEGLYEDGVSSEDVNRILMRREGEHHFHFIYACPVCTASVWAFEAYSLRPEKLHGVKAGDSTFGWGLRKKIRDDLHSDDVKRRLSAINTLIGRWIERRMDTLRLTEKERAELADDLDGRRELGMARLNQFRRQMSEGANVTFYAPAYLGQDGWECAACNAVVGKAMHFGEKKGLQPDTEAEQGGANQPATADRAEGELIIEVLLDGNVIVENEKFSKEQLKKKLLKHPNSTKNLSVALTFGHNVSYKHTIDIVNVCQEAGFPNIVWRGYWKEQTEQDGAEQPATAPKSKPEGKERPKPESKGRSQ